MPTMLPQHTSVCGVGTRHIAIPTSSWTLHTLIQSCRGDAMMFGGLHQDAGRDAMWSKSHNHPVQQQNTEP